MSLITEELKPSVNTLEEVKKLQELVRKLEIQNLHLRNKQNTPKGRSVSPVKRLTSASNKNSDTKNDNECNDKCTDIGKDEYFDDLDIIRVSDIELSDDESWLYKSPKSSTKSPENCFMWLKKDANDKQLQLTKGALLSKVTELNVFSPPKQPENPAVSNLKRFQNFYKTPTSSHDQSHVDTRTFTRTRKKEALEFLERIDLLEERGEKNCSSKQLPRRGSNVSSDSLSSCHVLEDASDVEEVARMQEESLRMSSPLDTPKRSPSPENEFVESNYFVSELSNQSDQSSPSESPYSSNMSLHSSDKAQGKLSGYRRSLPNLNREPLAVRQPKSIPNSAGAKFQSRSAVGRKTDTYIQPSRKTRREFTSPFRQTPTTSNFLTSSDAENVTVPKPAESRLRARSGLPRPSRASSASRSAARSGIPMPSMSNKKQEDSWSEGCF